MRWSLDSCGGVGRCVFRERESLSCLHLDGDCFCSQDVIHTLSQRRQAMCDYSLAAFRNRLAVEGEELMVYRFPTGCLGLISPDDPAAVKRESGVSQARFTPREIPCAVCIPPGARLLLHDIPEHLQRQLGVGAEEHVTFIQTSAEAYRYRDAVRFKNGREILLQSLNCLRQMQSW